MRIFMFFRMLIVLVAVSPIYTNLAYGQEHVACNSQARLETVITHWVPAEDPKEFQDNCSLLTEEFSNQVLASADRTLITGHSIRCDNSAAEDRCVVWIVRTICQTEVFFYEVGFVEVVPVDAFDEGVVGSPDHDGPILQYRLPSGKPYPSDCLSLDKTLVAAK